MSHWLLCRKMVSPGIYHSRSGNDIWISLSADLEEYSGSTRLKAGEVYRVIEPDSHIQPEGLWKDPKMDPGIIERWDSLRVEATLPQESGGLYFQLLQSDSNPANAPLSDPVYSIGPLEYESFDYTFDVPTDQFGGYKYWNHGSTVDVRDSMLFSIYLGINTEDIFEFSDFLSAYDLRRPFVDLIDGKNAMFWKSDFGVHRPVMDQFLETEVFWDELSRSSLADTYADFRLYNYPIKNPISIADLRHLSFKGMPPFALGSSAGESLNKGFDRYFYSTVPLEWQAGRGVHPSGNIFGNSRLELRESGEVPEADDLRSVSAAQHFYTRGSFNVNSTNVNAWMAVLQQSFEKDGWHYRNINGFSQSIEAEAMFFRHNQSSDQQVVIAYEDGQFPIVEGDHKARNAHTRQGFRWVHREQIRELAKSIVHELKKYGKAFESLEAFLKNGLLERAIKRSGINDGMLTYGNTYLRQSDLMAALSLFANVRSDTFVVRSYGESVNPVTGETESRAILEALVQRVYDFVDDRPFEAFPNDLELALRSFKVIQIRWIE